MAELDEKTSSVQDSLQQVLALLRKHQLLVNLVQRQVMPRHELVETLVQKQSLADLQHKLDQLHPADVAYIAYVTVSDAPLPESYSAIPAAP